MSKKEFDSFLKRENDNKRSSVDWEAEKKKWIENLDILFNDIKSWLKEYVDSQKIIVKLNNIDIFEEALGSYSVQEMTIIVGNKTAKLTPIGTILIGTKGRVDLTGKMGSVRFILAPMDAKGPKIEITEFTSQEEMIKHTEEQKNKKKSLINLVWKITSNPPKIKYSDLNQDSFLQCLMEVING